MARITLAVLLFSVAACNDRTGMTAPDRSADVAPHDSATGIALTADDRARNDAHTALSGGATTVFDASKLAFGFAAPNLDAASATRHATGDLQFAREFVTTPGSADAGLGPVFDNTGCESCHAGDGRGRPPLSGEPFATLLFRASVAGVGPNGAPNPVPGFGTQLQLRAIGGVVPRAQAAVSYTEQAGAFADGTAYSLRVPQYTLTGSGTPLPAGLQFSPRVAPVVFGLGLLEAVPEEEIVSHGGQNGSGGHGGVAGRPNYVWDVIRQRIALGRFGWKANTPSLAQQAAGAFNGDIGITSLLFPAEPCEAALPQCAHHPPEIGDEAIADVTFYTRTLAVPARRGLDDPVAQQGEKLFYASGCNDCHAPTLRTGTLPGVPAVSNQVIHPYTDLLLHDMGSGLADERADFQASGREWRTPPLWGIGLVETVSDHSTLLHDGRARSFLEAILWHDGEAAAARDRVRQLGASERAALVAFLKSL